jgi:hypothetical protein
MLPPKESLSRYIKLSKSESLEQKPMNKGLTKHDRTGADLFKRLFKK